MRLWSLHPKYLDPQGLVALWREALLAQAVLRGKTRGYRHHPQLERFQKHSTPVASINAYLKAVHSEAAERGYSFDGSKVRAVRAMPSLSTTHGQLDYEWQHLMMKLEKRSPAHFNKWQTLRRPEPHPLFRVCRGGVESWERPQASR